MLDISRKRDYLYLLPAVVLVVGFFVTSIGYTVVLSFFSWDGVSEKVFIGVQNYTDIFNDNNFWISVANTVYWVVFSLLLNLVLPLVLAILIVQSVNSPLFKNIFYFPATLSGTVGGLIMVAMLSTYGIPQLFGLVGFEKMVRDWLSVPVVNTFVMIFMQTWRGIGVNLLLFIAGLRHLDRAPIEAAQIEGASRGWLYMKVIFPALSSTTKVVLLMSLVNSFKVFDIIWIMTKGGPYRSSETLALSMYIESFVRNNYGVGASVAILLTCIILIAAYFNLRNTFKSE
ncbi:MAG: sugar ABC transporter permease [Sphaerochaetaceae bacterium]|nr:sugar ABC transporter permease [Sphaerochaetaceae bacterium]